MSLSIPKLEHELLVNVDNVKYRQSGKGKSPLGTLSVYRDFQRVSAPDKDKVQLQICLLNEDQATFVFMRSGATKEVLTTDRELIKEAIQQQLHFIRQQLQEINIKAGKERKDEFEAKKKYLQENNDLQTLYRYLVSSKLISPENFWSLHQIPTTYKEQLGIPSGFLSSIKQTEDGNGIRVNITDDTIREIFKTYPVVERKHLELVPHAMTEEDFWTKFFQSHYFHRERDMNEDPNDPFFDCDKDDIKEMREGNTHGDDNPMLNFGYLLEDLGIVSDIRQNFFTSSRNDRDEDVDRLVRRCNYHSGRLLSTLIEKLPAEMPAETSRQKPSHTDYNLELDSAELADIDKPAQKEGGIDVALKLSEFETGPRVHNVADAKRWKSKMLKLTESSACSEEFISKFFDDLITKPPAVEKQQTFDDFFKTLKPQLVNDVKVLYPVTRELLRHFWICLPANNPEAEENLTKMHDTLVKFEELLLKNASNRFGIKHTEHLFTMIAKAKDKFAEHKRLKGS